MPSFFILKHNKKNRYALFVAKHSGLYIFINKGLQLLLHLNLGECLDDVTHLYVVVVDE